jgi:hypothetical protein
VKAKALKKGDRGAVVNSLQHSINARLNARGLSGYNVKTDGHVGDRTLNGARKAAWILGALPDTYNGITKNDVIPVGVFRMIRNPGKRTPEQIKRGKRRLSHLRKLRRDRNKAAHAASSGRLLVVKHCLQAAANYRSAPGAYHYLAGGIANLIYLKPSPNNFRSDCSQFASSVQHDSKLPDLGPNGPLWVSTFVMAQHLDTADHPMPGDFGMYGPRSAPHHVEVYLGAAGGAGHEFVGHGSPPIDSLTPGRPDFYLKNPIGH